MTRETCSASELQTIILESLKECPGFEKTQDIQIQPREQCEGGANWMLASVRPRVDSKILRGARETIDHLQRSYELNEEDAIASRTMKRRA